MAIGARKCQSTKDRTADTLVGNIKANVVPSTPVQTDGWASYRRLQGEGFPHGSVNRSASEWNSWRRWICDTVSDTVILILFLVLLEESGPGVW